VTAAAPGHQPRRRARFPRRHRLKRQRLIRPLFEPGRADVRATRVGPLAVRYRLAPLEEVGAAVPVQVGFAVSRGAGDRPARNRIKRHLREVYRVHQHALVDLFADRPAVLTIDGTLPWPPAGARAAIERALPAALARVADAVSRSEPAPPPIA
jgi:ribonuclease P protein component